MDNSPPLRFGRGIEHNPSPLWTWDEAPMSTSKEEWARRLKPDLPLPDGLTQMPLFEEDPSP